MARLKCRGCPWLSTTVLTSPEMPSLEVLRNHWTRGTSRPLRSGSSVRRTVFAARRFRYRWSRGNRSSQGAGPFPAADFRVANFYQGPGGSNWYLVYAGPPGQIPHVVRFQPLERGPFPLVDTGQPSAEPKLRYRKTWPEKPFTQSAAAEYGLQYGSMPLPPSKLTCRRL